MYLGGLHFNLRLVVLRRFRVVELSRVVGFIDVKGGGAGVLSGGGTAAGSWGDSGGVACA